MSVQGTNGPSTLLENYKKVAPGKKEQIFLKTVSVAAFVHFSMGKSLFIYILISHNKFVSYFDMFLLVFMTFVKITVNTLLV